MHRMLRKYAVSLLVVPGVVLGVSLGAIALAPGASQLATTAGLGHTARLASDTSGVSASNQTFSTQSGSELIESAGSLAVTDSDPEATFTYALTTPASDGSATLDANNDGGFTYTPNPGFAGADDFQYTVTDSDGNTSSPATVTINVVGVEGSDQTYTADENTPFSAPGGTLDDGVTDSDGSATCCTASLAAQAANGTAALDSNGDGGFTYTPDSNATGPDSFSYTLTDSDGNVSAPVTVNVNVSLTALPTKTSFISENPLASAPDSPDTFVVSVSNGTATPPTGRVLFTWYTVGLERQGPFSGSIGSAIIHSGSATITATNLPAGGPDNGNVIVKAVYVGDAGNATSTGYTNYYVLPGCRTSGWSSRSNGYPVPTVHSPVGYYIGQSNGWFTVYTTPSTGPESYTGSVSITNGVVLDLSSTKNKGHQTETLVGDTGVNWSMTNRGDLNGFEFFAGCGSAITFTLNIEGVPATKKQIHLGNPTKTSTTAGTVIFRQK